MTTAFNLCMAWKICKDAEDQAKKERLEVEEKILSLCDGEKTFLDLQITYGTARKWDQKGLAFLSVNEIFPFRLEYIEDLRESRKIEALRPKLWKEHFSPLLTITPRKPGFKWKAKK